MKKKGFIIFSVLLILLISLFIVSAQLEQLEDINPSEKIETWKEKAETRQEYLQNEWKNILLKNKFISPIDNFFNKINIVFKILFNENYNLTSLTMWFIIILWIIILLQITDFTKAKFNTSTLTALGMGVLISIILAQIKVYNILTNFIIKIAFTPDQWYVRLLIFFIIFILLIVISKINKIINKITKKTSEEHKSKTKEKELYRFFEGMNKERH